MAGGGGTGHVQGSIQRFVSQYTASLVVQPLVVGTLQFLSNASRASFNERE